MDELKGKTGIVIHAGMAAGARTWGKIMMAVHLDWLVKLIGQNPIMVIEVDGDRRVEPFYEAHFVACEPGEHEILVWMGQKGPIPGPASLAKAFTSKVVKVTVVTNELTHLTYTPGGLGQVKLELGDIR